MQALLIYEFGNKYHLKNITTKEGRLEINY